MEIVTPIDPDSMPTGPMFEQHYSVPFLSKLWGYSEDTVLRWFKDEPGVLRSKVETYNGRMRTRTEIRIPKSVAVRVYARRAVKAA